MDPEKNLREQLALAEKIQGLLDQEEGGLGDDGWVDELDVARLCELVQALDRWMRGGGHIPARWAAGRPKEVRA